MLPDSKANTQSQIEWLRQCKADSEQLMLQKFRLEEVTGLHHLHLLLEHYAFLVWEQMNLLYKIHRNTQHLPDDTPHLKQLNHLRAKMLFVAESDINLTGQVTDLLAVYKKGMDACGANSANICTFQARLRRGEPLGAVLRGLGAGSGLTAYVTQAQNLLENGSLHQQLAVLAFAPSLPRLETLMNLLDQLDRKLPVLLMRMRYYFDLESMLQKQVFEPMASQALTLLCDADQEKWNECAAQVKETSLARAGLLADARAAIKQK